MYCTNWLRVISRQEQINRLLVVIHHQNIHELVSDARSKTRKSSSVFRVLWDNHIAKPSPLPPPPSSRKFFCLLIFFFLPSKSPTKFIFKTRLHNSKLNPNFRSCNTPFFNHFFKSKEYYGNNHFDFD